MERQALLFDESPADPIEEQHSLEDKIEHWFAEREGIKPTRESEYQWPASRLEHDQMTALRRLSNQIGRPINQLIKEAAELYAVVLSHRIADSNEQPNPNEAENHQPLVFAI